MRTKELSRITEAPTIFKINNKQIVLSENQLKIFNLIVYQKHPRNQIIAPTQYGKSLTVALSVLTRSMFWDERFIILAPTEKKASIIMNYVLEHCFDDSVFLERLELEQGVSLDRLRRERSRNNLTYKGGGGVMILTLDARNQKRNIEAALGFGGNRIILDESSLIDDTLYATVKRMLGGYKYKDTFLLEIGNPFYRNHFFRTWHDSSYHKIFIDYKIGLSEGRYSPEFIEEMRQEAFFDVFYECQFPDEDVVDDRGYRQLLANSEIRYRNKAPQIDEPLYLGADIGGGGDDNVYILRSSKYAWVESRNRSSDTMTNVSEIRRILQKYPNLEANRVFIDDIGIGRGVSDRLKELDLAINGVSVGSSAQDGTKYKNIKAEAYWGLKIWLHNGGKLVKDDHFRQLSWIKYKINTDKVIQMEPKEELIRRTGKSPDFADALMLTFVAPPPVPNIRWL